MQTNNRELGVNVLYKDSKGREFEASIDGGGPDDLMLIWGEYIDDGSEVPEEELHLAGVEYASEIYQDWHETMVDKAVDRSDMER